MPKHEEHIGDKLLAAIKAKGVTQADVARHFKVAAATVSADWIKHGRIAKKHIPGLVDYFGMPYQYWLGPDVGATVENQSSLTQEERQVLSLMRGIRKDALETWIKMGGHLSEIMPERRKEDSGHQPERRRHFGIFDGKRVPKPENPKLRRDKDNDG